MPMVRIQSLMIDTGSLSVMSRTIKPQPKSWLTRLLLEVPRNEAER